MLRFRKFISPLLLLALAMIAAHPLWWKAPRFYFLDDGFLQLFRLFEFDRGVRAGAIYPRWSPDSAYGFGYPFFNFYPPLSFYFAEAFHLCGLSIPDAIKVTFSIAIVIGLTGAYFLGVELSRTGKSVSAGITTASGYVFFPYFLLNIYTRGALAESLAMAFLPWLVWAVRRIITRPSIISLIFTTIFSACIVLAHNLIAYLSLPLLASYVLFELAQLPSRSRWKAFTFVGAGVMLGAALAAVYWLPMLAEYSWIAGSQEAKQLSTILQFSFLPADQTIQFSLPYQYQQAPFPLAFLPMSLAAGGLVIAIASGRNAKTGRAVIFFMLGALAMTILLTDWSKNFWLSVPLLSAVQFPWRLSVVIGLCVAVTIGLLPEMITAQSPSRGNFIARNLGAAIALALAVILIASAQMTLAPQRMDNPRDDLTVATLARFEMDSHNLGLGWMSEFLPLSVQSLPQRLDSAPNPTTPTIQLQTFHIQQRSFTISTTRSISITWRTFYFPGWQGTLDNQPIRTFPSMPMGLLTMVVPPGNHQVALSFTDTMPRRVGTILSIAGIFIVLALVGIAKRQRKSNLVSVFAILGIGLAFFLPTAFVASSATSAPLQTSQTDVAPQLRLIGLQIKDARYESGVWHTIDSTSLNMQAIWQIRQAISDEPLNWQFVDSAGKTWGQQNPSARFGTGFPAAWVPNEIVQDDYALALNATMPNGRYALQTALPNQPFVSIGVFELERRPNITPAPVIANPTTAQVGNAIQFIGYNLPARGNPGETVPLTLFWRTQRNVHEDLTVFAQLLDQENNVVAQHDGMTQDGFYPTMLWQPGEIVTDPRDLALPPNLKPGIYHLVAGLYRYDTFERLSVIDSQGEPSPDDAINLGEIKVPMNLANAKPQNIHAVELGSEIRLLGYDLNVARGRAQLKLFWQAQTQPLNDYKVFVHLVDANGNLVTQQDRAPGDGNYPTRIWDANEKIVDTYELPLENLPAGPYHIYVGIYASDTGERLTATDSRGNALPDRRIELAAFDWSR